MGALSEIHRPQQNYLLSALTADSRSRLFPHLELVYLPRGKVLHDGGGLLRYTYFPTDAIVAILAIIESGASMEVSMVGNEGMVGTAIFMGGEAIPRQTVVQNAGHAYRLTALRLKDEFDRHGEMLTLLLRYTQALITQTAQTAMCNRHHSIDQQLCRMLLQSLDRLPGNELHVTQEQIAAMLGVRRESVTEAVGKIKKLGLIECRRGKVYVLDRPEIEQRCCECYDVVRGETLRLLPWLPTRLQSIPALGHPPPRLHGAHPFDRL